MQREYYPVCHHQGCIKDFFLGEGDDFSLACSIHNTGRPGYKATHLVHKTHAFLKIFSTCMPITVLVILKILFFWRGGGAQARGGKSQCSFGRHPQFSWFLLSMLVNLLSTNQPSQNLKDLYIVTRSVLGSLAHSFVGCCMHVTTIWKWSFSGLSLFKFPATAHACPVYTFSWKRSINYYLHPANRQSVKSKNSLVLLQLL